MANVVLIDESVHASVLRAKNGRQENRTDREVSDNDDQKNADQEPLSTMRQTAQRSRQQDRTRERDADESAAPAHQPQDRRLERQDRISSPDPHRDDDEKRQQKTEPPPGARQP
jgi:hypothetical protein